MPCRCQPQQGGEIPEALQDHVPCQRVRGMLHDPGIQEQFANPAPPLHLGCQALGTQLPSKGDLAGEASKRPDDAVVGALQVAPVAARSIQPFPKDGSSQPHPPADGPMTCLQERGCCSWGTPSYPFSSQGDGAVGVSRLGPAPRVSHPLHALQPLPSLSPAGSMCPGVAQPCTHSSTPAAPFCTHMRVMARLSLGSQANKSYAGSDHKHEIF